MTPNPRVSVIIPAFNADAFIGDTLASVVGQTYENLEIIVSDDGSTDGTRECASAWGRRVRCLSGGARRGPSAARNAGIRAASGSLLAFIDADDVMAPSRVDAQVEFLRRHPEAGLVFSDYAEFGECREQTAGHFATCPELTALLARAAAPDGLVLDPATATELLLTENYGSSSPMVRRAVVEAAGGYDEALRSSEDFEFHFRLASSCAVGILPEIQWHKRQHPCNASAEVAPILRRKIEVRRRILETETAPSRRRKLKRRIAQWHADLAYYYTGRDNLAALRHLASSVRMSAAVSPRLVARLALDLLGRDTNRCQAG